MFANTCSLFWLRLLSIPINLSVIGSILGLLPFDGVMLSSFLCLLTSIHFSLSASLILMPVSFSVCSKVAMRVLHDAISWSNSASVGMNGILSSSLYVGFSHFSPLDFR